MTTQNTTPNGAGPTQPERESAIDFSSGGLSREKIREAALAGMRAKLEAPAKRVRDCAPETKTLTLRDIAEKIVGPDKATDYLSFELPNESPDRAGFTLEASDDEVEIYRASDVYLLHCSTGLEIGMWDDLATDYPAVAHLIGPEIGGAQ